MTPEQETALKEHVDAIAALLYAESDPEALKTLTGIETTVRDQLLTQVSPRIGSFLSGRSQASVQDERAS